MKAIIDIGSTSVRLMTAERLEYINPKQIDTTKLAEGMEDGYLASLPMERTAEAVKRFVLKAGEKRADEICAYATEAVRAAKNREVFLKLVYEKCGIAVDILDSATEAQLGFLGAYEQGVQAVVDMGGASTELAIGRGKPHFAVSLPLGIVRLNDMEKRGGNVDEYVCRVIEGYKNYPSFDKLLAIGGTAGTMAAVLKGMKAYNQKLIHGTVITLSEIDKLYSVVNPMSLEDRVGLAGLPANRAEVIVSGIYLWGKLLRYLNIDSLTVSERDNMEGYFIKKYGGQLLT